MALRDVKWKIQYKSLKDNVLSDFYSPAINHAIYYKRITGYFTVNFLNQLADEIKSSVSRNELKIKILCAPNLTEEEIKDISLGYEMRETMEKSIISVIENISDENENLPFITSLIKNNNLDIKFVVTKNGLGMFHDKKGVFCDTNDEKIAFSGSNNETQNAIFYNYESFIVVKSWEQVEYVNEIENDFDDIWDGKNEQLIILAVTENIENALEIKNKEFLKKNKSNKYKKIDISSKYTFHDYQDEAIEKWVNNSYRGLLEMATGTGKTITALGCYQNLSEKISKLVTIITVPQIELLYQWEKDLQNGGVQSIICASSNSNWKKELNRRMRYLNTLDEGYLNVIVTRESFISKDFQKIMDLNKGIPKLLISDEVHSFGSLTTRKLYDELENIFQYRLGISATPFRRSEVESKELIEFFGGIIFSYSLKEAIKNGFLNNYEYHPVVLFFDSESLEKYRTGIRDIFNNSAFHDAMMTTKIEKVTTTIANSTTSKVDALIDYHNKYSSETQSIIYCSPGGYNDSYIRYDEKHIEYTSKRLGDNGARLKIIRSEVEPETRKEILLQFKTKEINTLLAIKCLDQGINLPEVSEAYILSSTDSDTEFIQRRGRILRTYKGKPTSKIYDFIMLPQDYRSLSFSPEIEDGYLVNRELRRMEAYSDAADNQSEIEQQIEKIKNAYEEILESGDEPWWK